MKKTKDLVGQEALEKVLPLNRAGIGVTVGGGKTLIGLKHMDQNLSPSARFLVVGPKLEIYNTWKDEAKKHNLEHLIPHFTFSTYISLPKQDPSVYDIIYLDECHSLKYSHQGWLNLFPGKILGLTGTPPKFHYTEKGKMVDAFCPIVYSYTTDEAIEDEILNDYEIIVHSISLSPVRNIPISKGGRNWFTSEKDSYEFWTNRIQEAVGGKALQIARIMRMRVLQDFPSKEKYAKALLQGIYNKVLIFANTHEQADKLCKHSFHSNNPNSEENLEKFKRGEITQLSAVHQLSEGVNIPDLREAVILHAYANERKSNQRIGRALRLPPDQKAVIHILSYKGTVDEEWVKRALEGLDKNKISWV